MILDGILLQFKFVKHISTVQTHEQHGRRTRLNKTVFLWAEQMSRMRCKKWNYKCKKQAEGISFELHNMNFNLVSCICKLEIKRALMAKYNQNWKRDLNRLEGSQNYGGNKLRTYRIFKVTEQSSI